VQRKKQDFPKIVTEDGISIEIKPVLANANSSICFNIEPLWNVTDWSDAKSLKQPFTMAGSEAGM
jgi:hypothetical protein